MPVSLRDHLSPLLRHTCAEKTPGAPRPNMPTLDTMAQQWVMISPAVHTVNPKESGRGRGENGTETVHAYAPPNETGTATMSLLCVYFFCPYLLSVSSYYRNLQCMPGVAGLRATNHQP